MHFTSIDIQGSILSADTLSKIKASAEQITHQNGKDFDPNFNNLDLKDEISLAWQEAKGQWTIFQSKLKRAGEDETAATETRNFWILPLLANLGYDFSYVKGSEELNGKSFWINNRENNLDGFPLILIGYNEDLDKRPEKKQYRVSPHALMQEYLNYSEHLYGLVTNGRQLRLLRDASRITRLSYLEFNLEKMMEEDLYSDFTILYRVLHASRMPRHKDAGPESIIEEYHLLGLEAGATIRDKLGNAVKVAIADLANGFINHPHNQELREAIESQEIKAEDFYHYLLRIIYRLLFLFVIEERNLVYGESKDPKAKRFNDIYFKYYSLMRLRKLARELPSPDSAKHYDIWLSLLSSFALFENTECGKRLGLMSLKGDLFSPDALRASTCDFHNLLIDNKTLLSVLRLLGYFENENKVLITVNYGGLDVEEFGSVYEGLLELKLNIEKIAGSNLYSCSFGKKEGGREFQSHYTPEELVQPLIKYSLEYLIKDRIKAYQAKQTSKEDTIKSLLSLRICDVACGSGHILLSAARRVALELARVQTDEEQPNPHSIRKALREVIKSCIYGVDKNPLAIELCKIALWLEAHNPGEPLSFLDHHIKCGDAIVGLAHKEELLEPIPEEAFKKLPGDDSEVLKTFSKKNKEEIAQNQKGSEQISMENRESINKPLNNLLDSFADVSQMPERTPEEIEAKKQSYNKLVGGNNWLKLRTLAHSRIAQFFIPKTSENKEKIMTTGNYFNLLRKGKIEGKDAAYAWSEGIHRKFFHWFIEFPEVMSSGGFDCILGNPPFLGGQKLSGSFGDNYLECIKFQYQPIGAVDLVTYFFRRDFDLINESGFLSLISTNTIAQGRAREDGLEIIKANGGTINHAVKSMKWPGLAAVEVALVTVTKQKWQREFILGGKQVKTITPYLDNAETLGNPYKLKCNEGKSFQGSIVLGKGFILEPKQAQELIAKDLRNKDVLFPYLNGDDLNNNPDQSPSRWVINFFDWSEEKAKTYTDCYNIVKKFVYPVRQRVKREIRKKYWWQFAERASKLYQAISGMERVLVKTQVTKSSAFCFVDQQQVFDQRLIVFGLESLYLYTYLQSTIHTEWSWKYGSTMKTDLSYTPSSVFETFPFPLNTPLVKTKLESIGEKYYKQREQLITQLKLGLTKVYNLFHQNDRDQQVNSLTKQFEKNNLSLDINQAIEDIEALRQLHKQMDQAVLEAYGWTDIDLRHDFYEVDYLPENDRVRFTIHPDARKEILKRLLELNHKIHQEEVEAGLWDKKKSSKSKKTKKQVEGVSQQAFDLVV